MVHLDRFGGVMKMAVICHVMSHAQWLIYVPSHVQGLSHGCTHVTLTVTVSCGITCICAGFHLVALDMPGTGLSSYRPPGVNYHFADYVMDVKRVVDSMFACAETVWAQC